MTKKEVIALLKTLSFPVFMNRAPNGTCVPYGVISITQPDNVAADDSVYVEQNEVRFFVYTTGFNSAIEAEVKKLFRDNHIYWTIDSTVIDDQMTLETEYTFDIIGSDPEPEPEPEPTPEPTPDPDDGGEDDGGEGN